MSRQVTYVLLGTVILALAYAVLFLPRGPMDALTGENAPIELAGAIGLFAASVLFLRAFLRGRHTGMGRIKRISLLVLAALFFLGAGEEISWGQWIFGLDTPAAVRDANVQDELNFHNLDVVDRWIQPGRLFQAFWVTFAVLIPLVCTISQRARSTLSRLIPVLPVWLAALFVINQAIAEATHAFLESNPDLHHSTVGLSTVRFELTESLVALLLAVAGWVTFREVSQAWRRGRDVHGRGVEAATGV